MNAPTSVSLFDQGLVQVLQASVTGLEPKQPYALALSRRPDGGGPLEPLAAFTTNAAGSAIVNTIGPIQSSKRVQAAREWDSVASFTCRLIAWSFPAATSIAIPLMIAKPPISPISQASVMPGYM